MKSHADGKFWALYNALPKETQELADKCFHLVSADPHHSSLHFKPLTGEIWSARVGAHYRALAIREVDCWLWFWIGPHEAYNGIVRRLGR